MFGLLAAFGNLGGILMPWLVGVTADCSSLRLGLATSTACPLLMAFVLLWMQRRPDAEFARHARRRCRSLFHCLSVTRRPIPQW